MKKTKLNKTVEIVPTHLLGKTAKVKGTKQRGQIMEITYTTDNWDRTVKGPLIKFSFPLNKKILAVNDTHYLDSWAYCHLKDLIDIR